MSDNAGKSLSLAGLAEAAGLPRRTIRFYVARGLLAGPLKAGRNAEYSGRHLERLHEIQRLQNEGLTLLEIAHRLAGGAPETALPEPLATYNYAIAPDITVQVQGGVSPWRMKQIREALRDLGARLARAGEPENADNH